MCPMLVEGTTIHAMDVESGAALVFTTTGDLADLRRRAARMAAMHNRHQAHDGGMMGGRGMAMVPADARAEETEGGARIVFTPRDPSQLDALREHVERMAERMAAGHCPMMEGGSTSAPAPQDTSEHEAHHPGTEANR